MAVQKSAVESKDFELGGGAKATVIAFSANSEDSKGTAKGSHGRLIDFEEDFFKLVKANPNFFDEIGTLGSDVNGRGWFYLEAHLGNINDSRGYARLTNSYYKIDYERETVEPVSESVFKQLPQRERLESFGISARIGAPPEIATAARAPVVVIITSDKGVVEKPGYTHRTQPSPKSALESGV